MFDGLFVPPVRARGGSAVLASVMPDAAEAPSAPAPPAAASRPPRRVLHLVLTLDIGGLESVVLNLARGSDPRRFEHHVACLEHVGTLAPRFAAAGIPVSDLRTRSRLLGLLRLRSLLRRLRPVVLHTHNVAAYLVGGAARLVHPVPALVHTRHGRTEETERARLVWAKRWTARLYDAFIPVSRDAAEQVGRLEGVPPDRMRVLHNGIPLPPLPPTRSDGAWPARGICVARLHPLKDHETLLRTVRRVVDGEPGFRFDLVGDGPERDKLERLRDELRLSEHVRFLGSRDDVPALLSQAGVFLLTSSSEGLALTVLEAMAAGLPVIATNVGGNREVVVNGQTGVLVPPRSPEEAAAAVLALLRDPRRAEALGRAGRTHVERQFGLPVMVARYESLYEHLVAGRPLSSWRDPAGGV